MELLLEPLRSTWGLVGKPESKKVLASEGADSSSLVGSGWEVEAVSRVLGHSIQCDEGISEGCECVAERIWSTYFANVRTPSWRRLGT